MFFRHHTPAPPLSEFVESFWIYEHGPQPHALERILPTGTLSLIINLQEDLIRNYDRFDPRRFETLAGAVMVGAHSEFLVIDTAAQESVVGISFRPGGAFPFFRMPMGELRDQHVPLDELWKAEGASLRERLLESPTPELKFKLLENFLRARMAGRMQDYPTVAFALDELRRGTVRDVTGRLGVSPKRFIRLFQDHVGLTPKLYCRISRFQDVLSRVHRQQRLEWADIAISCGYFDQAHFVHDFRAFAGMTPTAYEALRGPYKNHIPLPD